MIEGVRFSPCLRLPAVVFFGLVMPRKKIDLAAVRACLDTICPKCGHRITPDKIVRVDWERQKCPVCGEIFEPHLSINRKA
jgi:uncharacterized protein (UPF0212 family)